jgi:hypothetical protein
MIKEMVFMDAQDGLEVGIRIFNHNQNSFILGVRKHGYEMQHMINAKDMKKFIKMVKSIDKEIDKSDVIVSIGPITRLAA